MQEFSQDIGRYMLLPTSTEITAQVWLHECFKKFFQTSDT